MKLRAFSLIPVLAFSLAMVDSCVPSSQKGPPAAGPGDVLFEVETILPELVDKNRIIKTKGIFNASDSLIIQAPFDGSIEKVYVNEGDMVSADDPLVLFSSESVNALIESKQAELKEAEASLEHDQKNLELFGGNTNYNQVQGADALFLDEEAPEKPVPDKPTGQLDPKPVGVVTGDKKDLESRIKLTEAKIERLNKELDRLEQQLENLTIKTTISGIVKKRHVTEGTQVSRTAHLFEIISLDPISLSVEIPQKVSSYVDKMVKAKAYPVGAKDMAQVGVVYYISPTLNLKNKTLEVRLNIPNPKGTIKGGQDGEAEIITRKVDKILKVPEKALVKQGDETFIYVVNGNQAVKTPIEIKETLDDHTVLIDANIRVDDPIVISEQASLENGSFVKMVLQKVQETPPTPPTSDANTKTDLKKEEKSQQTKKEVKAK